MIDHYDRIRHRTRTSKSHRFVPPVLDGAAFSNKTDGKSIQVQFDELTKMVDGHSRGLPAAKNQGEPGS